MEALEEALESLKLCEKINYTATAKKYGVDRNTLSRRHRGVQGTREDQYENQRVLNTTQEKRLIQYIEKLSERGIPPTHEMVHNFASEIIQKPVGKNWVYRFLDRNHHKLFSRYSTAIDRCRFQADSALKYTLYFELLSEKIRKYRVQPSLIYNMDEKGFLIGILGKQKRIFSKPAYKARNGNVVIQDGSREWITVLASVCADGQALPPALIYKAASGQLQDTWLQDFDPRNHRIYLHSSPSGWTNNEAGLAWLNDVFQKETKAKAGNAYRLLIVDGHGSHLTMEFIDYCDRNKILLAVLPPHSTHTLQPLDVGLFSPLAASYRASLRNFLYLSQGLTSITKRDFYRLFWQAWCNSFIKETIKKAFKTTGIVPLNPKRIITKFTKQDAERPSSSSSSVSLLNCSKPATIERLVSNLKAKPFGYEARLLTKAIVGLATENLLLTKENFGLKEALINERKRRQRGKPLLLEPPKDYHGGAIFYSLSKVQEARDRQKQKDEEAEQAQHQKNETIRRRAEEKLQKQQELEYQREKRLQARETKLAMDAEKTQKKKEEKEAKQLTKQLKTDLQLSKKGRKQAAKSGSNKKVKDSGVKEVIASVEPEVVAEASSRVGRRIKLPAKFK